MQFETLRQVEQLLFRLGMFSAFARSNRVCRVSCDFLKLAEALTKVPRYFAVGGSVNWSHIGRLCHSLVALTDVNLHVP